MVCGRCAPAAAAAMDHGCRLMVERMLDQAAATPGQLAGQAAMGKGAGFWEQLQDFSFLGTDPPLR